MPLFLLKGFFFGNLHLPKKGIRVLLAILAAQAHRLERGDDRLGFRVWGLGFRV